MGSMVIFQWHPHCGQYPPVDIEKTWSSSIEIDQGSEWFELERMVGQFFIWVCYDLAGNNRIISHIPSISNQILMTPIETMDLSGDQAVERWKWMQNRLLKRPGAKMGRFCDHFSLEKYQGIECALCIYWNRIPKSYPKHVCLWLRM